MHADIYTHIYPFTILVSLSLPAFSCCLTAKLTHLQKHFNGLAIKNSKSCHWIWVVMECNSDGQLLCWSSNLWIWLGTAWDLNLQMLTSFWHLNFEQHNKNRQTLNPKEEIDLHWLACICLSMTAEKDSSHGPNRYFGPFKWHKFRKQPKKVNLSLLKNMTLPHLSAPLFGLSCWFIDNAPPRLNVLKAGDFFLWTLNHETWRGERDGKLMTADKQDWRGGTEHPPPPHQPLCGTLLSDKRSRTTPNPSHVLLITRQVTRIGSVKKMSIFAWFFFCVCLGQSAVV